MLAWTVRGGQVHVNPRRLLERDPSLLTESQWASVVNDLARIAGFRRYHTYLSKRSPAGFPDLVLLRPPRLIFVELKRDAKESKVRPEQEAWLDDLREIERYTDAMPSWSGGPAGVEVYVWRPSDWPAVVEVLTGRKPREEAA